MRILNLHAENIKRLRAVDIAPGDAPVVIIGGDNGQGKTSVLDSIMYALAGKRTEAAVPVRRGADEANVELDLGDLRVVLRIGAGRRELVVTNADGERRPSPQGILDALYSRVTFDPLQFSTDPPDKQSKTLRGLVGIDFSALDKERAQLYEERTRVGRELASASERLTAIPVAVLSSPPDEVNIGELVNAKTRAASQNQRRRDMMSELGGLATRERELMLELERVRARIAEIEPYVPESVDTSQMDIDLANAEATNRNVRLKQDRAKLSDQCRTLEQRRDWLTKAIDKVDATKAQKLAAAPWPVPGLGFSEDGVLLNGLPFDQASGAEKLRVSLAIGAALNPQLRVLLIRDGSLLDARSMATVRDFAASHDMQVWIERVGGADPGAVIIEDGQVLTLDDRA